MMTNKTMMTAALAILLTAAACRKNDMNGPNLPPETIVFTIDKAPEHKLFIELSVNDADKAGVWADLNDNGKMDEGEAAAKWNSKKVSGRTIYTKSGVQPGSSKITIHGKAKGLGCRYGLLTDSRITSLSANSSTLEILDMYYNKLTELDTRKLPALKQLYCGFNRLTSLDLSNNRALEELYCLGNRLTSLDLSNNKKLSKIYCNENAIKGAGMDRLVNSLPDMKGKTTILAIISPGMAEEKNVCSKAQVKVATGKGWSVFDDSIKPYPGS